MPHKSFVGWSEARSPTAVAGNIRNVALRTSLQPTKNRVLLPPNYFLNNLKLQLTKSGHYIYGIKILNVTSLTVHLTMLY